jgi:acetylornithine deacetylase/succinyl-diaminopimelate desuccinylase-like protein
MDAVLNYLEANKERFIRELCEYMRFPSVSAQPKHQADLLACAQWLDEHFKTAGLKSQLHRTAGNPIVVAHTSEERRPDRPHFGLYGHYDVQPPEPFELWKTEPFEARVEDRKIFGRGASDNKGQHFAHIKAIEAYLKTDTPLPCDVTFVIEGEEEVGCANLAPFLKAHRDELRCDAVVISDTGIPSPKHPALTYALRGIAAMEIIFHGPDRDVHSGIYGGSIENPAMALSHMLAKLRGKDGRITVPGFYDDVVPLTAAERKQLARIPFKESEYRRFLGVPKLFGEKGYTPIEQRSARPTIEINGLTSGYQGDGSKTIVPSWARAKITMRLVPNQKPARLIKLVADYLKKICPPSVRVEIKSGHGGEAYMVSPSSPLAKAALNSLRVAFGSEPVLLREGGSIPVVNDIRKILGVDCLLLGLGLPDDNPHAPNEKFSLDMFELGMRLSANLWPALTEAARS